MVMRGQSFAGEALGDIGTTGGSGAFLVGVGPLWGFVGDRRDRRGGDGDDRHPAPARAGPGDRDRAGGRDRPGRPVPLLDTTYNNTTGATVTILFGSVFAIASSTIPLILLLALLALAVMIALYRPLLLSTVSAEMAAPGGSRCASSALLYLLALALATALAAITIGTILSTALLDRPRGDRPAPDQAATARRCSLRLGSGSGRCGWGSCSPMTASTGRPPDRLAGELLRGSLVFVSYLLSGLPELRRRTAAGMARRGGSRPTGGRLGRDVLRLHGQRLDGGQHRRRRRGSGRVLHGPARLGVRGSRGPQRLLRRGRRGEPVGLSTLLGLGVFSLAGALGIGLLGRRGRHDVVTALALVMMLGLGALFLSFSVEYAPSRLLAAVRRGARGQPPTRSPPPRSSASLCVLAVAVLYRPLMLSSVLPEVGEARGVSSFRMEMCFLAVLALATTMSVPVVGALLIFSLMIGAPAAARSLHRPAAAGDGPVGRDRAADRVGGDRRLLYDRLAGRVLRRHCERGLLRAGARLGGVAGPARGLGGGGVKSISRIEGVRTDTRTGWV